MGTTGEANTDEARKDRTTSRTIVALVDLDPAAVLAKHHREGRAADRHVGREEGAQAQVAEKGELLFQVCICVFTLTAAGARF